MQLSTNSKMKVEKKFAIVSFPDEYEHLFIVASQWLLQDELSQYSCFWPPYKSEEKVQISVLKNEKPEGTWQKYSANLVIKCKTYEGAESIRNSIMKISARQSSLLFDQLQESISSQTKPPSKEMQFKSCVFPDSSLLIYNDIMRKLISMKIEDGVPRTVSIESSINLPNILKVSTSCQTEQINISSTMNTVCDSCKSKASISKPSTETSITKKGIDTSVGTGIHRLTCMKEHEDNCLEELIVEDLTSGTSGATSVLDCIVEDEFQATIDSAGASSATLSWSAMKFKPPTETNVVTKGNDSTYVGTRLQCITCMKENEDKSFEELRMGDLCLGVSSLPQFSFSQQKTAPKSILDTINENVFATRWTANKFKPPTETNVTVIAEIPFFIGTRLQCITCMKEYEDKSLEELRVEELSLGTFRISIQPPNPFRATFPFSSTFAFTFKKPIRKPRIYPLLFGTSGTTDAFNEPETSHYPSIKFRPVAESDILIKAGQAFSINTLLQSITCMKEYKDKSFEELRMEHSVAGQKESFPVGEVFQKPTGLSHLFSTCTTASTVSGTNFKSMFDATDVTNGFKSIEASRYPAIKFQPIAGSDSILKDGQCIPVKTRLQSITCMAEYKDKSFEELRMVDLVAAYKESSPGGAVFQKPDRLSYLISALTTASTVSSTGTNSKSVFDTTDVTNGFKSTEDSRYPAIKFQPIAGSDSILKDGQYIPVKTRLQSITSVKKCKDKGFEELRVEDLFSNHKGSSPVRVVFGAYVQSTPFTFPFSLKKSKLPFHTKDVTRRLYLKKSTSGIKAQPACHHWPFYVSSSTSGEKTI